MRHIKTYDELMSFDTFIERYRYLRIGGKIGDETFGFERYLNQVFYKTPEWLEVREFVILRDNGCDLGILDREIQGRINVHHINPLSRDDLIYHTDLLLNPDYLISTSDNTHKAIHYGSEDLLIMEPIIRFPNDTCPWRRRRDG